MLSPLHFIIYTKTFLTSYVWGSIQIFWVQIWYQSDSFSFFFSWLTPPSLHLPQWAPHQIAPPSPSKAHHFIYTKLTFTNYLFWKTQVTSFLCSQKLIGFIDSSIPAPPRLIAVEGHPQASAPTEYRISKLVLSRSVLLVMN